jgi:hypothetical protein
MCTFGTADMQSAVLHRTKQLIERPFANSTDAEAVNVSGVKHLQTRPADHGSVVSAVFRGWEIKHHVRVALYAQGAGEAGMI